MIDLQEGVLAEFVDASWRRRWQNDFKGLLVFRRKDRPTVNRSRKGAAARSAKFTDEQVVALRQEWASGVGSATTLAKKYGIRRNNYQAIVHGRAYVSAGGPIVRRPPAPPWKCIPHSRRLATKGVAGHDEQD